MQVQPKQKKAKQAQRLTICTAEARSVKPLLQAIIAKKANWVETLVLDKCKVRWVAHSTEPPALLAILQQPGKVIICRFPGMSGLARKDTFSTLMTLRNMLASEPFAEVTESIEPKSFLFPQQTKQFSVFKRQSPDSVFIAKPKCGSEGNNCLLFQNLGDLPGVMANDMIVQRYIPNPMTLEGLKFDLRIYVVLVDLDQPQAYICSEGLARFCTEPYQPPAPGNFKDFFRHLTNYSINKHHEEYKESYDGAAATTQAANENSKRTLASTLQSMAEAGIDVDQVQQSIESTCREAMEIYLPHIRQGFVGCMSEHGVKGVLPGKAFHVLGLDILIDQNLKAWLLEMNDNPSLYIYLEKDYMGGGVEKEISRVDLEVKSTVVADAIMLAKRSTTEEWPATFRSYRRLCGLQDVDDSPVIHSSTQLMKLFTELCQIKDRKHLTLSGITNKLANRPSIQQYQLTKPELTVLFQKHIIETKCGVMSDPGQQLDYREFCLFVCERVLNFLKTKNRVDANLTAAQFIEGICDE